MKKGNAKGAKFVTTDLSRGEEYRSRNDNRRAHEKNEEEEGKGVTGIYREGDGDRRFSVQPASFPVR